MKKQHTKLQILLVGISLSLFLNINAQIVISNDSKDDWTNQNGWSWTLDDNNDQANSDGFRWWNNGGSISSDLMMQLTEAKNLNLFGNINFNNSKNVNGIYHNANSGGSHSWIELWGNDPVRMGELTLGCKALQIYVNSSATSWGDAAFNIASDGQVSLGHSSGIREADIVNIDELLGYNDLRFDANGDRKHEVFITNDSFKTEIRKVIFNYGAATDLAQVSINTDKHVTNAALTVAGPAYIGAKAELAAAGSSVKFNPLYLTRYSLWVEKGVVSEDFAFANIQTWMDKVFSSDYDLMSLEEIKAHIEQNKHLPNVPSEKNIKENGYTAHQMNMTFMQKIEELTLHVISLNERIKKLEGEANGFKNK